MNEKDLKIYSAIGKIQSSVFSSNSFDEAIKNGLKIILSSSVAECAVIWYASKNEKRVLRPYYWISPVDITSNFCKLGENLVGRVCAFNKSEMLSYEQCSQVDKDSVGVPFGAVLCIPFELERAKHFGCIQFIKTEGKEFSEVERDTCELLTSFTQMAINESAPLPEANKNKKVLISCKDVKKSYKNGESTLQVLKGVSFDVFKGEFLCLLGESGCGKSTMLNAIGGLIDADGGSIKFMGQELVGLSQQELTKYRRENIGFIFQSYNLMNNLTAIQNLDLIAELVKEPMDSAEALKLVGLNDKANSYPSQLSGGQQQRVSIARALVKKPKLIFADEPTAALDFETSIEVLSVFEEVVKSGTTLVMVTHNEEIAKMADRVIRFKNGYAYETTINHRPCSSKELEW